MHNQTRRGKWIKGHLLFLWYQHFGLERLEYMFDLEVDYENRISR